MREYSIRRNRANGQVPSGSPEHREKISAAVTEHWKTRPRPDQRGELNPRWAGDNASGNGMHTWVRKNFVKSGVCSKCGKEGKTDRAFLRHPEPYTRNIEDYAEMCRSCHMRMDYARRKPW